MALKKNKYYFLSKENLKEIEEETVNFWYRFDDINDFWYDERDGDWWDCEYDYIYDLDKMYNVSLPYNLSKVFKSERKSVWAKAIDMNSIYSKEVRREKILSVLFEEKDAFLYPTLGDILNIKK